MPWAPALKGGVLAGCGTAAEDEAASTAVVQLLLLVHGCKSTCSLRRTGRWASRSSLHVDECERTNMHRSARMRITSTQQGTLRE